MRLFRWLVVFLCFGLVARAQTSVTTSISAGGASITSTLSSNGDWTSSRTNGGVTGGEYRYNIGSYVAKVAAPGSFEKVAGDWVLVSSAKSNVSDPPATFNGSVTTQGWHILWTYYVRIKNSDNSGQSTIVSQSVDWIEVSDRSPQNINAVRASTAQAMARVAERWDVTGNMTGATPSIESASNCNVLVTSAGVMMVTPTAQGAYSFVVTVAGDDDYYMGMDAAGGTAVAFEKNWKFNISNATENPIAWRVIQGGDILDSGTAPSKSTGTVSGKTDDGETPIKLQYRTDWTWNDEAGRWERLNPPVWIDSPSTNIVNEQTLSEDSANLDGVTQPNKVDQSQVSPFETVKEENESDALTAAQFAEGIGKVEAAINTQGKAIKGATTEVMQAVTGVNTSVDQAKAAIEAGTEATQALGPKLDEINAKLQSANEQRAQQIEAELEARTLWERITTPIEETWAKQQEIETLRAAAAAEVPSLQSAAVESAKTAIPDIAPSNYLHGDPTAPNLSVTLPTLFGGKTIDLNPFQFSGFATIVAWFRSAMLWLVVVHFAYWVSGEVKTFAIGFSAANQAQGNQVMGSGGQATAAVNAGVVTVAFSTLVASLLAFLYGDFQLSAMVSIIGASPLAGMPAAALWFLDKFFPIAIMLTGLALRVTWRWWGIQAYAVAAAVIRWCIT